MEHHLEKSGLISTSGILHYKLNFENGLSVETRAPMRSWSWAAQKYYSNFFTFRALTPSPFALRCVMYLQLLGNALGQDVTNPNLNTCSWIKKKVLWVERKHTQTGKEGTVSPAAVTSFFRFPLPTSSLMQLLIFLPRPVTAEHSGLLCLLLASGGLSFSSSISSSQLL